MPGEERDRERDREISLLRKVRSLSRLFLKLLHSTYYEFLASSPVFSLPLPSQSQYDRLKTFLTELTVRELEEVEGITLEEVVEAASLVLGQRTVERFSNNINISGDFRQDLLQPEDL